MAVALVAVFEVAAQTLFEEAGGVIRIRTDYFEVAHPQVGRGGLPQSVKFVHSGHVDSELFLFDRVYQHSTKRMYSLRDDRQATARVVEKSATRVVVESRSRYVNGKGNRRRTAPRRSTVSNIARRVPWCG